MDKHILQEPGPSRFEFKMPGTLQFCSKPAHLVPFPSYCSSVCSTERPFTPRAIPEPVFLYNLSEHTFPCPPVLRWSPEPEGLPSRYKTRLYNASHSSGHERLPSGIWPVPPAPFLSPGTVHYFQTLSRSIHWPPLKPSKAGYSLPTGLPQAKAGGQYKLTRWGSEIYLAPPND